MATCGEFMQYISDNFETDRLSDRSAVVRLDIGGGRGSDAMVVAAEATNGDEWAVVACRVSDEIDRLEEICLAAGRLPCGAIRIRKMDGVSSIMLSDSLPLADLDESEVSGTLVTIAKLADDLKQVFGG